MGTSLDCESRGQQADIGIGLLTCGDLIREVSALVEDVCRAGADDSSDLSSFLQDELLTDGYQIATDFSLQLQLFAEIAQIALNLCFSSNIQSRTDDAQVTFNHAINPDCFAGDKGGVPGNTAAGLQRDRIRNHDQRVRQSPIQPKVIGEIDIAFSGTGECYATQQQEAD